ncbi:hypothetical protein AZI85_12260 [Bdellovibrio bacteriovorus]|uniref:Adenylate cyclase n=1 Tax=Bdellovibrio bacteriovorus TaxID=959 RepID=A0A150WCX1_BDEBC|nr:hypothetical protein [Bdellovibrio bacteriovorus]KYG60757.1 hypothetical protein AZI85_12260 [Bdellovibrio bacteriovorus]
MFVKNKKNKSIVFLIVFTFWVGYISVGLTEFYANISKLTDAQMNERKNELVYLQESFIPLVIEENYSLLTDRLNSARQLQFLDFFIVQRNGEVLTWYNNFDNLDGINVDYKKFNAVVENDHLALRTVKIGDTKFTVGIFQDKAKYIRAMAWMMKGPILREILLVTILLSVVVYIYLKDIIDLSKILASRSREKIAEIKTNSKEAETILQASMGLEGERVRLEKLSEVYSETVGPAILHELKSGKEAPYNFEATMCRVDLNGYTQMFLEKDNTYLITILNQYFARAREVIQRYDGLIYQFVGDEIVFHFKDDMTPGLSTESLAAACIRDLFYEATVIENGLPEEANYYFKLKGSFAHGVMRFIKLDEGHAMSGLPLIESVRLLSLVDDKSHQVLTFFQDASQNTEGLLFVFDRKVNQLKGFKEESMICRARDFNSIEWIFESAMWDRLSYFRADAHMLFTLKKLRLMAITRRDDDLVKILHALRFHKFETTLEEISKEAETTFHSFFTAEQEKLLSTKVLSAYVSLIGRIIPKEHWTKTLEDQLAKLLDHDDYRVQANTIVVLGKYGYPARKIWENMFSKNNRVAADTIVEVAKQQLNADVWDALHRLLSSTQASHRSSGDFALESILKYYGELDPVYLKTNPFLIKMQGLRKPKAA